MNLRVYEKCDRDAKSKKYLAEPRTGLLKAGYNPQYNASQKIECQEKKQKDNSFHSKNMRIFIKRDRFFAF